MITAIRHLFKAIVSVTVLVVLITVKKLHEDFGVLSTGKRDAEAIHIMNTFPDSPLALLVYKLVIEVSATFCVSFALVQAVFGTANEVTAAISVMMAGITLAIYVSYRKTLKFFCELEEKIMVLIKERKKEDDINDRKTDA